MITSTPSGGAIRPKRTLNPWAKASALPGVMCGATCSSKIAFCSVSGARIITTSARSAASPIETTSSPCASALALDAEPSRSPISTLTPESLRLRAWPWPWLP